MLARRVIRSEVTPRRVVQQFILNHRSAPVASFLYQGFHTTCKTSYASYDRPEDQTEFQNFDYISEHYEMPPKKRQSEKYEGGEGFEGGEPSEKRQKSSRELRGEMGKKLVGESGDPYWEVCMPP
jgi:hypothetical protein